MINDLQDSFLLRLTERLAAGWQDLDPERAGRHRDFILKFQQTDGGFAGRKGDSDLYYTSFAVRGLALLNALDVARAQIISSYLKSAAAKQRYSLIDLVSWFYSAITIQLLGAGNFDELAQDRNLAREPGALPEIPDEISSELETFRRPDGGYAKTHEGGVGSTYHTFLAVLCYEMIGRMPPDVAGIVRFFLSRRREDGGFVEIGVMKRSGANPTAAAAVLLKRFEAIDRQMLEGIEAYLSKVKGDEGGFRANTQIPFCDLLSTFTGLLMTHELGLAPRIDAEACRGYIDGLELAGGGFRGAAWDDESDPEYTFYGLGSLALLRVMD